MKLKKTRLLALAGAALLAAIPAWAQSTYTAGDLLLIFRNPATPTADDLEINVGSPASLSTGTLVPASLIQNEFGVLGTSAGDVAVGFSAAAADAPGTDGTLWLTRADTTPGSQPSVASAQQTYSSQNPVTQRIGNIGAGYNTGAPVSGSANAVTVSGGATDSYQTQGQQSVSAPGVINFNGYENVNPTKGGNIESVQDGSGNVYEALWKVPATTSSSGAATGATDTYLGYFTFKPSGEVDFAKPGEGSISPTLAITLAPDQQHVIVSWSPAGNTLYSSTALGSGASWTAVGTNNPATIPASGAAQFFYVGK